MRPLERALLDADISDVALSETWSAELLPELWAGPRALAPRPGSAAHGPGIPAQRMGGGHRTSDGAGAGVPSQRRHQLKIVGSSSGRPPTYSTRTRATPLPLKSSS